MEFSSDSLGPFKSQYLCLDFPLVIQISDGTSLLSFVDFVYKNKSHPDCDISHTNGYQTGLNTDDRTYNMCHKHTVFDVNDENNPEILCWSQFHDAQ